MARLQILELPHGAGDERPPFVLIVDQYQPVLYATGIHQSEHPDPFDRVAEKIGARAALLFEETVDIPANHSRQAQVDAEVAEAQRRLIDALRAGRRP